MKYFTIAELSHSNTAVDHKMMNEPNEQQKANLKALTENVLDPAREKLGGPIEISNGFRCQNVNKLVGGAPTSQHTTGEAADLKTLTASGLKRLFCIIQAQGNFDQLIWENTWIHVSYREGRLRHQVLKYNPGQTPRYVPFDAKKL